MILFDNPLFENYIFPGYVCIYTLSNSNSITFDTFHWCPKLVYVGDVQFLAAMDNQLVNEKDVRYFGSVTMLHL